MSDDQKGSKPANRKVPASQKVPARQASARPGGLTLASLNAKNAADHATMVARLNGHDEEVRSIKSNFDRLDYVVRQLGERLGHDHDAIMAELTPQINRLEELVGKGVALDMASAIVGFTPEEVKEILEIQSEEALSNSDIVSGLVEGVRSLKSQLRAVGEVVADHTRRLNTHSLDITELRDKAEATRQEIDQIRSRSVSESVPLWGWIVSAILGIVAGLWWSLYDWGSATHVSTSNVDTPVGSATVQNTAVLQSAANNWIAAAIAGLTVFVLALWLISLLSDKRRDHEDREEKRQTIRQRVNSHYETKRQEKAEARRIGGRLLNNISEPEPEREAVS